MGKHKIAFPYFGGKYSHLRWLLPLLPTCNHFVDVFGGSAAVLLNREPSPIETYNDLDGEIVNFFRMLRDRGDELVEKLRLTPSCSREEFEKAVHTQADHDGLGHLERARRFYVLMRGAFSSRPNSSKGQWRSRVEGRSSVSQQFINGVENLSEICSRLRNTQIERQDAFFILKRYDSRRTLFYLDPPYNPEESAYKFKFSNQDIEKLYRCLKRIQGRFALSCYSEQGNAFERFNRRFYKTERHVISWASLGRGDDPSGRDGKRTEVLYTNYPTRFPRE